MVDAVCAYIEHYLTEVSTYVETAWRWELELMPDPALVFRWLATLLRCIALIVQQIQQAGIDSGMEIASKVADEVECPNSDKAWTGEKLRKLDFGALLLSLLLQLGVNERIAFVHRFFLHSSEISFACLSGRRNIRICRVLSRSHRMQCELF